MCIFIDLVFFLSIQERPRHSCGVCKGVMLQVDEEKMKICLLIYSLKSHNVIKPKLYPNNIDTKQTETYFVLLSFLTGRAEGGLNPCLAGASYLNYVAGSVLCNHYIALLFQSTHYS